MKLQTFLLLLSIFTYGFAQGSSTCCQRNQITVSGKGIASAMPDIGVINLVFQQKSLKTEDAVKALSSKVNQAIAILRDNGIGSDDYQTRSFTVDPEYNYNNGKNEIVGQKAHQQITVKVKRLDDKGQKIGKLIDALSLVQNIIISSVSFDINDKAPIQEKARAAAFNDAKAKAEDFAQFAGLKVGRVVTIDDSEEAAQPYLYNYAGSGAKTFSAAASSTSVPLTEQDLTYRTKITFNFY